MGEGTNKLYECMMQSARFGYAIFKIRTDTVDNVSVDETRTPVDYEWVEVNAVFEALTGLSRTDILNKSLKEVMSEEEHFRAAEMHSRFAITHRTFDWKGFFANISLNDVEKEFEYYSEPLQRWYRVQVSSPEQGFLFTIFVDITKEKEQLLSAANALRESESRFRNIFEELPVAIWEEDFSEVKYRFDELRKCGVTDFRDYFDRNPDEVGDMATRVRILKVNHRSVELLGAESEPVVVARELPYYFSTESMGVFKEEIIALAEGKSMFKAEIPTLNNKGERLLLALSLSVPSEYTHTLSRVLLSFLDITERKRVEAALVESNRELVTATRAKSDFLAHMSHEIRTPLNGVIGFTDLLLTTPLNQTQRSYVENANISAHSLLEVVNDILDFSKIEAGKMELELIKTDIIELMEQVSNILKFQAEKKGLKLCLHIQPDLPRFAVVDGLRLKQILVNLLGNAIKFTQTGEAELKVTFTPKEATYSRYRGLCVGKALAETMGNVLPDTMAKSTGFFHFSVRDTGIGIPEEQQNKLFKAFSQADASTTRKFGGTGLGLMISNLLAQKMGSKIELRSEHGSGSTFFFTLETAYEMGEKLEKPAENGKSLLSPAMEIATKTEPVILVAEDMVVNMLLITTVIKQIIPNVKVLEATTGQEAIDAAASERPDMIFMDIQLPEIDGMQATIAIRKQEQGKNRHIPIIAVTAGVTLAEKEKCMQVGMDGFLGKPITREAVLSFLKKYLTVNEEKLQNVRNRIADSETALHFDKELLMDRIDDDGILFQKLMATVPKHLSSYFESLEIAIREKNEKIIKGKAHSIKGASLNMCFNRLADLAKELELSAEKLYRSVESDSNETTKIFREMIVEWEYVQSLLKLTNR